MGLRSEYIRRTMLLNAVEDCLQLNQLIADEIEKLAEARDQLIDRARELMEKYHRAYPDPQNVKVSGD